MKRRIAVGETPAFRYIGVKRSLDVDISRQIIGEIAVPTWFCLFKGFRDQKQEDGRLATQFEFYVEDTVEALGSNEVDLVSIELSKQIAEILRSQGETITVHEEVVGIDNEHPLFSRYADQMRSYIRNRSSQQPTAGLDI